MGDEGASRTKCEYKKRKLSVNERGKEKKNEPGGNGGQLAFVSRRVCQAQIREKGGQPHPHVCQQEEGPMYMYLLREWERSAGTRKKRKKEKKKNRNKKEATHPEPGREKGAS
jgi:hypothetical protein